MMEATTTEREKAQGRRPTPIKRGREPREANLPRDGGQSGNLSYSAREAITYFRPLEEREEDRAPLSVRLIKRVWTYSRPYKARRNWLFFLTFFRGVQLPALA